MVRETKHKQFQTRRLINKQMITKFTNMVWVRDALAFGMFGNNRMPVLNFVKVRTITLLFLINRPILIFNLSRSSVNRGNMIIYKYNKSGCSSLRNMNMSDNT
jgi:hypothetical protein